LEFLDELDAKSSLFEYRVKKMRKAIEEKEWILEAIEVIDPPFW
jgi:hypothetical protein